MAPPSKEDAIIIVGAGVFGLSTALDLRKRGYREITVLDRMVPPVLDGSSNDISRIVRSDYGDPFYAAMAAEAQQEWRSGPFKSHYYNTGFVLSSENPSDPFLQKLQGVFKDQGRPFKAFNDTAELQGLFPALDKITDNLTGYLNPNAGWANAAGAIGTLAGLCTESGVSIVGGPRGTVQSLRISGSRIEGVNVAVGPPLLASRVILATGAWTNRFFDLTYAMSSSAHAIGFIQLTPEEAHSIAKMPTMINMTTGFFVFPPSPGTNLLKVANHGHGYETSQKLQDRTVSAPKRDSNNAASQFIPESSEAIFRKGLKQILPQFADRPWVRRRLCWYTDTPEGNFVVDHHPQVEGLFIAAGGAGQ